MFSLSSLSGLFCLFLICCGGEEIGGEGSSPIGGGCMVVDKGREDGEDGGGDGEEDEGGEPTRGLAMTLSLLYSCKILTVASVCTDT